MAHIRSRKHSQSCQPKLRPSLIALAALSIPLGSHAQEQTLPEIKVQATADVPYKAERVSSPKLTQPLLDTPQTISVIKKEIMQEQGAVGIMEALRNTPGITMQLGENGNTSAGDTFQMRGFATQTSVFVDGVRDLGAVTRDTFNIDQIEVVKGPSGSDIGRGASSGYINLSTKLPQLDNFSMGSVSWSSGNSANSKRATVDLNKTNGGSSAIRVNAMTQGGGVPGRDEVENNGYGLALAAAFGLNTPTRFYLYTQSMRQKNVPDGGVPTIGLPGFYNATAAINGGVKVDPTNYYGTNSDYEKISADMITGKIEHDFGGGTVLRNITRYGKSSIDRILTGVDAPAAPTVDPASWTVTLRRQALLQDNEIFANQTNVTTEFATGSIQHSLTSGVEIMLEKQFSVGFTAPDPTTVLANLYRPNMNVGLPRPTRSGADTDGSTTTTAVYTSDTLKLNERWLLNGGIRLEHYNTKTMLSTGALSKRDNLFSWKTGAVYKPASNGSLYAAYANSLTPPGSTNFALSASTTTTNNVNSPALDPQETKSIEFGTKWDVLQKKLSLTAAVYRIDNTNEVTQIDAVTNTFSQFGKRRVEGVEFGAVGQLTNAWQLSAGIATMRTKVLAGSTGNSAAGAATRWSPDLTATVWSSYKLTPEWTIGGGARYVSEQKRVIDPSASLATQSMPSIPAYWVADAMTSYQMTRNVSLQFNVYNLFDKFYINTLNNSGARYTPGAPRWGMLSANFQF